METLLGACEKRQEFAPSQYSYIITITNPIVTVQVSSVMETLLGACEKRQEFATRGLDRLMAAFEGHKQVNPPCII